MLKINEWKLFNEIDAKEIPTDLGIYEFWIKSDSVMDGKYYYGKAKNLRERFRKGYLYKLKNSKTPKSHNMPLNTSIKKHGINKLYYRIREIISYDLYITNPSKYKSILTNLEEDYIGNALDNNQYLFNLTSGGDGSSDWYELLSEEDKLKFCLKRAKPITNTGIFRVIKLQNSIHKKLYFWRYQENNGVVISRTSLRELKKEVEARGLDWVVLDEEKARKSFQEDEELENDSYKGRKDNSSGILHVSKKKHSENLYPNFNNNDWGSEDPNDYKVNDPDNVTSRIKVSATKDKSNLLNELNFNALNKYYDLIKQHFPENYLEDIKKQADKTNKKENTTKPNNEPSNKTEDNIYSSMRNSTKNSQQNAQNNMPSNIAGYLNPTAPSGEDKQAYELNKTDVSKSQSPKLEYVALCLVILAILVIGYRREKRKDK